MQTFNVSSRIPGHIAINYLSIDKAVCAFTPRLYDDLGS